MNVQRRFAAILAIAMAMAVSSVTTAWGQGFLMPAKDDVAFRMPRPIIWPGPTPRPQPQQSYKIKEIAVQAKLVDQVAKVQVSQTFQNTGNVQMEVTFVYPLPYDGAVDSLTFMVDDKEYEAKLLDAKEARQIYESYVRRNIDPALMEWMGTGMFKTSVFPVPPGKERKVTLRYTQLAKKDSGVTDFIFPLRAAKYTDKPVEKVALNVTVESKHKLKNVYSPSHPMQIERPDDNHVVLKYAGSNEIPASDFRLIFDVGEEAVGASVLSYRPEDKEEGYFLLMVSPEIKSKTAEAARKTVVFVVDRSGSMSGKKIEQAKGALKFVMNNLNEGDLFNIVVYDSVVESYKEELQRYDADARTAALAWVNGIYAGGSTNIDGALKAALGHLKDDKLPSYVIFLTDGLPTAGETKVPQIVANAKQRNEVRARMFSFGVGYDVNSRLLDKLSRECFGQSQYVRPNEDIEESVSQLYAKIGKPVLTGVDIAWDYEGAKPEDGPLATRVYPKNAYDLFAGEQLVMVGRYRKPVAGKVTISGAVGDKQEKFDFQASLTEKSNDESYAFIAKVWAMRRVGEIIDEIDLVGKNEELIDELVALSKKHGIITPYTSFLAEEEGVAIPVADARRRADRALEALKEADGIGGFAQRDFKGNLQAAAQAPSAGAAKFRKADEDKEVTLQSVQAVGAKTFFQQGGQWVDSTVTAEELKDAQQIKRFSKEYFDLVSKHGQDAAKYLAIEGNVVLRLGDQVYAF